MSDPEGIWSPRLFWTTAASIALIFLAALEALAVTTVMPLVSADLDGADLYAVAFAASIAAGIVGMVVSGWWSDRRGPTGPLVASVVVFAAGLVVIALAPGMGFVVAGRLVQGLGGGGQIVALYVVVARVYPADLHGRVFAAFAAAWIVPSLIGPFLAGAVAELLHWRWVFGGVAVLAVVALLVLRARLSEIPRPAGETPRVPIARRLVSAVVVAAGCLVLGLAAQAPAALAVGVVVASVAVVVVAVRPLMPAGTLRGRRGLPSVIVLRAAIAGAFFAAELYVPYLLIERDGFSATWAGLGLTGAALAWAAGSAVQGRVGDRWGSTRIALLGVGGLVLAIGIGWAVAAFALPPAVLIAGWTFAGAGMGLVYPRLTVLTLRYSAVEDQGFNSAALSILDSTGAAATTAVTGVVFVLAPAGTGFAAAFAVTCLVAVAAVVPALRLQPVRRTTTSGLDLR